jgi:hypothetical protein
VISFGVGGQNTFMHDGAQWRMHADVLGSLLQTVLYGASMHKESEKLVHFAHTLHVVPVNKARTLHLIPLSVDERSIWMLFCP